MKLNKLVEKFKNKNVLSVALSRKYFCKIWDPHEEHG